ncbi:hypothetical protein FKW77_001575 [Venturia effusa]|uniref:Mid2 domain-containing protein n=1 Tax=Venturia effusa TaxID=50376 RepID=A0A517LAF4_9PEZI|nr:hypothetical protein FKW77_001575 [Venturia effusa]
MLLNTIVLTAVAVFAVSVQADCATGKILGKLAVCGSNPVDCGLGLCCQQGATCLPDDAAGFRCSMPLANINSTSATNNTVLLNAGCYDIVDRKPPPSSTTPAPIAPATVSPSSGTSQASSNPPSLWSKLSKGAQVGIIVGSAIGGLLLLAILVTICLLARRRKYDTPIAAASARQEMEIRPNSSESSLQIPKAVVIGERSSRAKPRPLTSQFSD